MSSSPAQVGTGIRSTVGALLLGSLVLFAGKSALYHTSPPLERHVAPIQGRRVLTSQLPKVVECTSEQENLDDDGMYVTTTTSPPFLMNIHNPTVDRSVSGSIKRAGVFEKNLLDELTSALVDAGPESCLIDIGGNIGTYALSVAAKGHDVVAFEPIQMNWKRLCNSVNANPGFDRHVSLYSNAVVETPGRVEFGVPKSNPGHSRVVSRLKVGANEAEGVNYALGVQLDLMQDVLPRDRPIVMKLDIEGGECRALSGSLDYLAKAHLVYLQMEVMSDAFNCPRAQEVIDLLVQKGLTPHLHKAGSGSTFKVLNHKDHRNWFEDPDFNIGDIVWKKVEQEKWKSPTSNLRQYTLPALQRNDAP